MKSETMIYVFVLSLALKIRTQNIQLPVIQVIRKQLSHLRWLLVHKRLVPLAKEFWFYYVSTYLVSQNYQYKLCLDKPLCFFTLSANKLVIFLFL